jgi:hypothetical protein
MGLPTPQPLVTRPLLGINWKDSPLNLKPGELLDGQGLIVRPRGLYREPCYVASVGGAAWSPADNPLLLTAAWGQSGFQYPYLFTENYIFLATAGFTQQTWAYAVGNIDTSGTAVTPHAGSTPLWKTLGILPGDTLTVNSVTYTIAAVVSDSSITLSTSAGSQSNQAYSITRGMHAGTPYMVDAAQATDLTLGPMLVVATFNNQLIYINPTTGAIANLTPSAAKQPSTGGFTAECVAYAAGRIFAGHLNDGTNGELRQFLRWSKATDLTDFSDPTAYINLLAQGSAFSGAVRRMVPMGTLLLAYLDDALVVGSLANTPNLPLAWQQIPSGGVGVAGPRAIASLVLPREEQNLWGLNIAGHFFVGQDNVYFLSASSLTLQPVGSKIVKNSVLKCQVPERIQAAVDWNTRRVRFGFPRSTNQIENIYDFNWETKEWSYEARKTWLLGDPFLSLSLSAQDIYTVAGAAMCLVDGTTNMLVNWTSQSLTARAIYLENGGELWTFAGLEYATNPDGSANGVNIQTQDFDEGAPGMVKFWRMLRVKIAWDTAPVADIVFAVSVSLDLGQTWRSIGNLTVRQGETEGWINFRSTGPHVRFQLTSAAAVAPYYIVEISRLASLRGVQVSARQQHALP